MYRSVLQCTAVYRNWRSADWVTGWQAVCAGGPLVYNSNDDAGFRRRAT